MTDNEDKITICLSKDYKASKQEVFQLMTHPEQFPRFVPGVNDCTLVEQNEDGAILCWSIQAEGIPLQWKEQNKFDADNFALNFKALEGDLEVFEGQWVVEDLEDGHSKVTVKLDAKIGIPVIEVALLKFVEVSLKRHFENLLKGFEEFLVLQRYKNISDRQSSKISGFAVIGHPYNFQHLIRYLKFYKPGFKLPSQEFLLKMFELTPAYSSYQIDDFKSKTGKIVHGNFVMCPIIPNMMTLNIEAVVKKVIETCKLCEELGAGIATLGGFSSIAGEKYEDELRRSVNIPLTTGNTFTVAMVLKGIYRAVELLDVDLSKAKVTVIGGAGDIGGASARILSQKVAEVTITSRSEKNLMEAERVLSYYGKARIKTSTDNNEAIKDADIVIAAASTPSSMIDFNNFKPRAIVCDVGYPKNISYTECNRKDMLIFSGGITSLPSEFNAGFDLGLPSTKVLYGCFAESILLDLEERYENFSWGKGNITKEKVDMISAVGEKHGFEVAPFFWGNRLISEKDIEDIRNHHSVHS